MKRIISDLTTAALVICAVIMTTLTVRREWRGGNEAIAATTSDGRTAKLTRTPVTISEDLTSRGQNIGPVTAPITLVEFSDFECSFCAVLHRTLDTLQARHPNQVRVIYRHFPLPFHQSSMPSAIASECAGDAGLFPQFSAYLFEHQEQLASLSMDSVAQRVGIRDMAAFEQCRSRTKTRARVLTDMKSARALGIRGTPTLVLGREMITGNATLAELEKWIRDAGYTLRQD